MKKKGVLEASSVESSSPSLHFQKVVVASEPYCGEEMRLFWPIGRVLEFHSGVDLDYVQRLIEGIEGIL
ncbi:MAG: hypothetical protein ACRERV_07920 [Methylococcales bacterium]